MLDVQPPTPEDLDTVPAVARRLGVPERSLFRAVEKSRIPSRRRDGITVVSEAEVRAWADRRAALQAERAGPRQFATPASPGPESPPAAVMAGSPPSGHGGVAVGSGRGIPGATLDGDLASTLFAAFEIGESPAALVQRLHLHPDLVLAAYRKFQEVVSATGHGSGLADRVASIEAMLPVLQAQLDALLGAAAEPPSLADLRARFDELAAHLQGLPVPHRQSIRCECGATGFAAVRVTCTACGTGRDWGFHPPGK